MGTAALAPLWADNWDPGDPGMNSARHLLGIGRPIFDKSEKIALGTPRHPQGIPRGLKRQMRHGFDNMFQNAVKCDMVSTTSSKMLSNATWFRSTSTKYKYLQVPSTSTKYRYFVKTDTHKKWVFFCILLPIGIAYWPLLFRCGITAPCYSGVELCPKQELPI